ncbi:hypothetical protein HDV05_005891 [Chytridiales sp. JEL 0842]|nr:hypothetical protein HDV05_005891 [Chytridiales sp. JEL 0842]
MLGDKLEQRATNGGITVSAKRHRFAIIDSDEEDEDEEVLRASKVQKAGGFEDESAKDLDLVIEFSPIKDPEAKEEDEEDEEEEEERQSGKRRGRLVRVGDKKATKVGSHRRPQSASESDEQPVEQRADSQRRSTRRAAASRKVNYQESSDEDLPKRLAHDDDEGDGDDGSEQDQDDNEEDQERRSSRKVNTTYSSSSRTNKGVSKKSSKSKPGKQTKINTKQWFAAAKAKESERSKNPSRSYNKYPDANADEEDDDDEDEDDDDDFVSKDRTKGRGTRTLRSKQSTRPGSKRNPPVKEPIAPARVSSRTANRKSATYNFDVFEDDMFEKMLEDGIETAKETPKKPKDPSKKAVERVSDVTHCAICDTVVPKDLLQSSSLIKRRRERPLQTCTRCNYCVHTSCLPKKLAEDFECPDCSDKPLNVDKILAWRPPKMGHVSKTTAEMKGYRIASRAVKEGWELLVKFQEQSYLDVRWVSAKWVDGVAREKLTWFVKGEPKPKTEKDVIKSEWTVIDMLLDIDTSTNKMLVKWRGLPYESSTWEPIPSSNATQPDDYKSARKAFVKRMQIDSLKNKPETLRKLESLRSNEYIGLDLTKQPACVVGGVLKGYQMQGLDWLLHNFHNNQSSVLADDMGLGKTIQIVSFVNYLMTMYTVFPALVIVPNATIQNWMREFAKWAPNLVVVEYRGSEPNRRVVMDNVIFHTRSSAGQPKSARCHVVVTTYDIFTMDATKFKGIDWEVVALDEAHKLKNDEAKLFIKLKEVTMRHRVCLTGTPLQNNVRELFNLMSFIDPERFGGIDELEERFKDLNQSLINEIHEMIRPFFLRRTKDEVLTNEEKLPHKVEMFLPVSMTTLQRQLYRAALSRNFELLASLKGSSQESKKASGRSLSNILMELRKILNHPFLINDVEPMEEGTDPAVIHNRLIDSAAKLSLLHRLLQKLQAGGHRVLIFSQFTTLLDILEDYLRGEDFEYCRLDGSMNADEKMAQIDEFNAPDSKKFVFLLSTRSGGQGINLATADTIIIYDIDFNPHQDSQAMARSHRIGQTKPVLILKMYTQQSAEEKILEIAKKKLVLDHLIVGNMKQEEKNIDFESVLKFGAESIFNEDDELAATKAIKYTDEALDRILDRTEQETDVADSETKAVSSKFGYSNAWQAATTGADNAANSLDGVEAADGSSNAADGEDATDAFWAQLLEERVRNAQEKKQQEFGKGKRNRKQIVYNEEVMFSGGDSPVTKKSKLNELGDNSPSRDSDDYAFSNADSIVSSIDEEDTSFFVDQEGNLSGDNASDLDSLRKTIGLGKKKITKKTEIDSLSKKLLIKNQKAVADSIPSTKNSSLGLLDDDFVNSYLMVRHLLSNIPDSPKTPPKKKPAKISSPLRRSPRFESSQTFPDIASSSSLSSASLTKTLSASEAVAAKKPETDVVDLPAEAKPIEKATDLTVIRKRGRPPKKPKPVPASEPTAFTAKLTSIEPKPIEGDQNLPTVKSIGKKQMTLSSFFSKKTEQTQTSNAPTPSPKVLGESNSM